MACSSAVERLTVNQDVAGSIPAMPGRSLGCFFIEMLTVKNLTTKYGELKVLNDFSVTFQPSKITGIIGPNGAGKTTLIKSILLIKKIKSGSIELDDKKINRQILAEDFSYVPQKTEIDINFPVNVFDLVSMGLFSNKTNDILISKGDRKKVDQALIDLDIKDLAQKSISEISGGQRQRALVARALVRDVKVYVLDEPFNAIDAFSEKKIINILKRLSEQNKIIIVVNHNLDKLDEYFDDVVLMNHKLIAQGEPSKILKTGIITETFIPGAEK